MVIADKLDALRAELLRLGSVLVCYSGGVDSAFVLAAAHSALGPRAVGMTAVSPSLAPAELEDARAFWACVLATRAELEREGAYLTADEREVAFVEQLPKTQTGKIQRFRLRKS